MCTRVGKSLVCIMLLNVNHASIVLTRSASIRSKFGTRARASERVCNKTCSSQARTIPFCFTDIAMCNVQCAMFVWREFCRRAGVSSLGNTENAHRTGQISFVTCTCAGLMQLKGDVCMVAISGVWLISCVRCNLYRKPTLSRARDFGPAPQCRAEKC